MDKRRCQTDILLLAGSLCGVVALASAWQANRAEPAAFASAVATDESMIQAEAPASPTGRRGTSLRMPYFSFARFLRNGS